MKKLLALFISLAICGLALAADPVVSNISVSQRTDGSKITDIYYDLFDAESNLCDVSFKISSNDGLSFDIVPTPANLSGDVGTGLSGGTGKHIIWNAGAESYTLNGTDYLYRVYANDGVQNIPANLVLVQGGIFNNGVSDVGVSSFYIDKYEVTQASYEAVCGYNPAQDYGEGPSYPVYNINWYDAIVYCNYRSIAEGLIPCYTYSTYGTYPWMWPNNWDYLTTNQQYISCNWSANGYRLPTEAEWEFAARGGNLSNNYTYSGSNTIYNVAWYSGNHSFGNDTHEVGTKAANELGLYDMSGNVMEWCWDIYGTYPSGLQINPHGATGATQRVYRGGCYFNDAILCAVSRRSFTAVTSFHSGFGLRVCRFAP